MVLPIFYKVDKSELKKVLRESFREEEKISSWEAALTTAFNISGYVVNESRYDDALDLDLLPLILKQTLSSSCFVAPLRPHLWMRLLLTH